MSNQRDVKMPQGDLQPAPEDIKSEGRGFESQRRQHFSPMKYLLKLTCIHSLWRLYMVRVRDAKCINLTRAASDRCTRIE